MGRTIVGEPCAKLFQVVRRSPRQAEMLFSAGTTAGYAAPSRRSTMPAMKRQIIAGAFWFYAGWYATSMAANAVPIPDLLGPLVGLVLALGIAGDPRGRIWRSAESRADALPVCVRLALDVSS